MLKKRIIPVVLIDGFSVVKTIQFDVRRNLGSPITILRTFSSRRVDELVILDIDASKNARTIDHLVIKDIAHECSMPLTVGGGITSCSDIERLLEVGADKIVINTAAISDRRFVKDAVNAFGSQCIVGCVDLVTREGIKIHSKTETQCALDPCAWISELCDLGIGELFVNHVDKDGTMTGFDVGLAKLVNSLVSVPVIFCGGSGTPSDCVSLFEHSDISGVGVGAMFYFSDWTPLDCSQALLRDGIPARIPNYNGKNDYR